MRILRLIDKEIKKEEFEKKLGIKIDKFFKPTDDNFLKIYAGDKAIYLRCEDMKRLFGIDVNIFDREIEVKEDRIIMKAGEEIYKGKFKPLNKIRGI